jgi:hypothetical protein
MTLGFRQGNRNFDERQRTQVLYNEYGKSQGPQYAEGGPH